VVRLSSLVAQEPANRVWQRDLAHARLEAGRIASLSEDGSLSLAHLRAARSLSTTLVSGAEPLPEWQRLDALIRLRIAQHDGDGATAGTDLDRVVADLQRLAERAPHDLSATTAFANALIARGQWRERHAAVADARTDWQQASALLAPDAATSKDKLLLDPWLSAQILLGRRAAVTDRIAWLQRIGYRQPEFQALASLSDASDRTIRDAGISRSQTQAPSDPELRRD